MTSQPEGPAETSAEYDAARAVAHAAAAAFRAAQDAFRTGKISTDEYLVAAKTYKESDKVFDAAFAAERDRGASS